MNSDCDAALDGATVFSSPARKVVESSRSARFAETKELFSLVGRK